jgi:hypothetical protein
MVYGRRKIFGKVCFRKFLIKNFKKLFKKIKIERIKIKMMKVMKMIMINTRVN